jgi:hypothetical protein
MPPPHTRRIHPYAATFDRAVRHSYSKPSPQIVIPEQTQLLAFDASPEDFERAVREAAGSCRAQNYVATFRTLSTDTLNGASPLPFDMVNYFTHASVDAVVRRRQSVVREVARLSQRHESEIQNTHADVVDMMRSGSLTLFLHLPFIVSKLQGAAAVTANFSSGICWLRYPSATALIFSSGTPRPYVSYLYRMRCYLSTRRRPRGDDRVQHRGPVQNSGRNVCGHTAPVHPRDEVGAPGFSDPKRGLQRKHKVMGRR